MNSGNTQGSYKLIICTLVVSAWNAVSMERSTKRSKHPARNTFVWLRGRTDPCRQGVEDWRRQLWKQCSHWRQWLSENLLCFGRAEQLMLWRLICRLICLNKSYHLYVISVLYLLGLRNESVICFLTYERVRTYTWSCFSQLVTHYQDTLCSLPL